MLTTVQGSAEAIQASLEALSSDIVNVKVIQGGLGPITTSDISQAVTLGAKVVGFHAKNANAAVEQQAKQNKVQIMRHDVIYHMLQEVSFQMGPMLSGPSNTYRVLNKVKQAVSL